MRKLIYIVGGSLLYAAVNLMTEHLSFAGVQVVRPGIVVPLVCGVLLGPLVGFLVGFLGSTGSDLPTFGFYWNWSLGNGFMGLVAGSTPFLITRFRARFRSPSEGLSGREGMVRRHPGRDRGPLNGRPSLPRWRRARSPSFSVPGWPRRLTSSSPT